MDAQAALVTTSVRWPVVMSGRHRMFHPPLCSQSGSGRAGRKRRHSYLRAKGYGLRGLEVKHPGFTRALLANPKAAARTAAKADVPLLYWTAASWASAISLSKDNPEILGQIPPMEALVDRAIELDESY